MRIRVGDVIEPAALRRNVQYKVSRGINDHTTIYEPKVYIDLSSTIVSSRCKRNERAKRAHSLYIRVL